MANIHETLNSLFTDIADAIREVDGTEDTIIADNFPDKIKGIDTASYYIKGTQWENTEITCETSTTLSNRPLIDYGDGLWCCALTNGLYKSTDGKNYTKCFDYSSSLICYGNGVWIVLCKSSNAPDGNGFYRSTDLINWTLVLSTTKTWRDIKYANGIFAIAGGGGVYVSSDDGLTWEKKDTSSTFQSIAYKDGVWVVAKANANTSTYSKNCLLYSKDNFSTSLKTCTIPDYRDENPSNSAGDPVDGGYTIVKAGEDGFVAMGGLQSTGSVIVRSSDGITWDSDGTMTPRPRLVHDCCYHNGVWVAFARSKPIYSLDGGYSWNYGVRNDSFSSTSGEAYRIIHTGEIFIATGNALGENYSTLVSADGIHWYEFKSTGFMIDMKFANNMIVGVRPKAITYSECWTQ